MFWERPLSMYFSSSLHLSHLYASGKVGFSESTVVWRGQGGEEEGQEDYDLQVKVILAS